jgi:hypothetical protein
MDGDGHDVPGVTNTHDGDALDSRGGRQVNSQTGDSVQVGARVGTITDVGTVLIQYKTNDGGLRVASPWEVVKIPSLPQRVSLQL